MVQDGTLGTLFPLINQMNLVSVRTTNIFSVCPFPRVKSQLIMSKLLTTNIPICVLNKFHIIQSGVSPTTSHIFTCEVCQLINKY